MNKMLFAFVSLAAIAVATPALSATSIGNVGSIAGTDGSITAPPLGSTYSYVSTYEGVVGAGQIASVGGTSGSEYITDAFSADAGDSLDFYFNYITSDGSGFADYAFAELLDGANAHVAYLFTARTQPSGNTSPGFGLPANSATLIPATSAIVSGTTFSPLGGSSGDCYNAGCGHTGWIESQYAIGTTGSYKLRLGVTNWSDAAYDSALAFAGVTVDGEVIDTPDTPGVPEPVSWALMLAGFGLVGSAMRSHRNRVRFA